MSIVSLISILVLWIAAGLFASLFFFSAGYRFEPRREPAPSEQEAADREIA